MKLVKGKGSPGEGGCWMVAAATYADEGWTDHPKCVDETIRPLCITLNDWCDDGEREDLIGPHLFAPVGTADESLREKRLRMIVDFALGEAARALDAAGIEHEVRPGLAYAEAAEAAEAAAKAAEAATWAAKRAEAAAGKPRLLSLILDLCALSTPTELDASRTARVLRSVCCAEEE